MSLPFTTEQLLTLFLHYNVAIWPAPVVTYYLAIVAIVLALRPIRSTGRVISVILALLWLWAGIVFQGIFLSQLSGVGLIFAAAFVVEGLAFAYSGLIQSRLTFQAQPSLPAMTGGIFMLYALVLYPLIGILAGHGFPQASILGAPCPTTIFTSGLLLWTNAKVPKYLLVIPLVWSVVGAVPVALGFYEDLGLVVAGVLGTALLFWRDRVAVFHAGVPAPLPK